MPRPEAVRLDTSEAERSLFAYSRQAWSIIRPADPWVDGWVFGCLCEHLQAVLDGEIKKLGIACPPRHGKSIATCVMMPTYGWVRDPRRRYIFSSYGQRLAERDSRACRDLILSQWFQSRWGYLFRFKEDQNTQAYFTNDMGGFRIATTPGGWATGEGADIVIGDDLSSVEQAFSPAALDAAWRFWTQTMTLRFHDPEKIARVLSMQRTARGDVLGRAVAENLGYEVVTLPFEAEPHRIWYGVELPKDDPDHAAQKSEPAAPPRDAIIPTSLQVKRPELRDARKPGDVLWPERFSNPEVVKDLKRSVMAGAAGQLQQRPMGEAGAIFKPSGFRKFYVHWEPGRGLVFVLGEASNDPLAPKPRRVAASDCMWYQCVDTALTAEQLSDYFAAATIAKTPCGAMLVYHVFREKLEVPEQWPAMMQLREGCAVWSNEARAFVVSGADRPWPVQLSFQAVESKNSGIGLLQTARAAGRPLKELVADRNKVLRAATVAVMYGDGVVYHNAEGTWVTAAEDELTGFPIGHDDIVDALAYGGQLFVHDELLAAYKGPVVYNTSVHAAIEARQEAIDAGRYMTPAERKALGIDEAEAIRKAESTDDILAAIQGQPPVQKVRVEGRGDGRLDIYGEDD